MSYKRVIKPMSRARTVPLTTNLHSLVRRHFSTTLYSPTTTAVGRVCNMPCHVSCPHILGNSYTAHRGTRSISQTHATCTSRDMPPRLACADHRIRPHSSPAQRKPGSLSMPRALERPRHTYCSQPYRTVPPPMARRCHSWRSSLSAAIATHHATHTRRWSCSVSNPAHMTHTDTAPPVAVSNRSKAFTAR